MTTADTAEIKKLIAASLKPFDTRLKTIEKTIKLVNIPSLASDVELLKQDFQDFREGQNSNDELLEEFDNPISEADYYERYEFVKIWQDEHGGTAWENYQSAGKRDGRTWKKMKKSDFVLKEIEIKESVN